MGKHVTLTEEQQRQFKESAIAGNMPADLAKHFNIAISTVHNLRKKLKEDGAELPVVIGKRKKGWISFPRIGEDGTLKYENNQTENAPGDDEPINENIAVLREHQSNGDLVYKVIINGTRFFISPAAKEIHINGKDSIEVNF